MKGRMSKITGKVYSKHPLKLEKKMNVLLSSDYN